MVGTINCAREAEVDGAVAAARAAFESGWSTTPAAQRAALIHKFADLLEAASEEVTKAEVQAMGQPASIMSGFILPITAQTFRYYAGWADKIEGQTFPAEGGRWTCTQYEPIGVCAGIGPWNATIG